MANPTLIPTYDIKNCGPRQQFWANGLIVHNCDGINLQNLPRGSKHRLALSTPPGYKCYVSDLSAIEARMGAWRAGQWDLVEDFRNGVDIYSNFSSEVVFHYPVSKETKTERMVGKVCILGLGYGMGWKTFQRTLQSGPMGADPIPCTDEFARKCVQGYRERYPMIAQGWKVAEAMIVQMTDPNCNIEWGPLHVLHNCIRIPNGLFLSYPGLRQYVVEHAEGVDVGYEYWNGKFWKKTYGGLLVENITQCLAGLVIKQSMNDVDQWLQQHGLGQVVLQVHDEIIIVAKDNDPRFSPDDIQAKIQELMRVTPDWCEGLPLDCEGGYADEYSK
ncbi:hypothetical protein HPC37_02955 [Pasteurellaceae bacterium 20609_3]|uniref:DNA polymerase n=1 Tax=Spirabiliibacterium mucosae TaxID=28156 RepID=UPI001AAC9359|nr:DNA polymerase [Spirabiliibacterium mucosae]MBE2897814.1 hypothetical protein [Spirabiliibacterium mucosae]